jgi:hypothetical protein
VTWLELGQRLEGLQADMIEMRKEEEDYPDTLDSLINYVDIMLHNLDSPLDLSNYRKTINQKSKAGR